MNGRVYLARPQAKDATKAKPNVPAMIMFSARSERSRFMATLEVKDNASRPMPVFV